MVVKSPGTFISSSDGEMWDVPVTGSWSRNLGPTAHLMTAALSHTGTRSSKHALRNHPMVIESSGVWLMWRVTVSEWNMLLPSQDLMFWWKEVKGVCNSWWQHPRDWVLQLDVSIQWLHTPGLTARASSKPDQCQCLKCVQWASSHLTTSAVSNVNWMSLQKDKNLLKLSNN